MKLPHIICAGLVVLAFSCKEGTKKEPQPQEKTPEITQKKASRPLYEDLNGNPVQLSDYRGKRILLNYWATWCKPCIEEMPALANLQQQLSKENYVFLFASDQSIKVIQKFKDTKKFDLSYVKYNGTWADVDISALPVTLIYNAKGEQVQRFDGYVAWDNPEIIETLKAF